MAGTEVCFGITAEICKVPGRESWLTLADYIRDVVRLKGTKITCREGGCGACAVVVTRPGDGGHDETFVINSCICPVYLADGWTITTVEGLGNRKAGYHPIQTRMADYNASQCGFCSPGITMGLYGYLKSCPQPCTNDIEKILDGHICRCTGYRPILDAAKSLVESSSEKDCRMIDIEDLKKTAFLCRKKENRCSEESLSKLKKFILSLKGGKTWQRVMSLDELFLTLKQGESVRMVVGNTSLGVFQRDMDTARVLVDISCVSELHVIDFKGGDLVLGAALSLTKLCQEFSSPTSENEGFNYLSELARMLEKIANNGVRNMGTWAGNLMLQYHHPNFPSDISVILEAAGARLEICDCQGNRNVITLDQLWKEDMRDRVILNMRLSPMEEDTVFRAYKITSRATNSYPVINAAFSMRVDPNTNSVISKPGLVFGCVGGRYIKAEKCEEYIIGKNLLEAKTVAEALNILRGEINPPDHVMATSTEYRRDVAVAILYKFILEIIGNEAPEHLRSGVGLLERPLSRGHQDYQGKDDLLGSCVPKRGIIQQTAGETRYVGDIPRHEGEVHAAYVLSTIASGSIDKIDTTEALNVPGVITILTAKDLAFVETDVGDVQGVPMLSADKIEYIHEPIAMVIAESQLAADLAAGYVKVSYKDIHPPILDIHQAIEQNSMFTVPVSPVKVGDVEDAFGHCENVEEREVSLGVQNHFFMESQTCLCIPNEDTMDVWSSTQTVDGVQHMVAKATDRSMNSVHVTVPAIGGGFGGKEQMSSIVAASVAAAAVVLNRPVRMTLSLKDALKTSMKRPPMVFKYKIGFDERGTIMAVSVDIYMDSGREPILGVYSEFLMKILASVYTVPNWMIMCYFMKTNQRTRCSMRSPLHLATTFFIETVMDLVAKAVLRDPLEIRLMHMRQPGEVCLYNKLDPDFCLKELWEELRETSDYEKRTEKIEEYNKNNRWRKRGMSVVPSLYQLFYNYNNQSCFLAVYQKDGSVAVSHGGVEMGQGINTKVCQAVAQTLGIPVDLVHCQPGNSLVGANCAPSGGSVTSEIAVKAALQASKILQERMLPIREKNPKASWKELVSACHLAKVDLTVQARCFPEFSLDTFSYNTYGICVAEAEVDILTGQYQISRVDILMDLGESMNPMLDVGQIEGAFVMGMGYMLTEKEILDPGSGNVLSAGTHSYKVPMAQDIPADFRVSLRKDSANKFGLTRSRAVGEPPITMACSVVSAIRAAVEASREERGYKPEFLSIDPPLTVDKVQRLAGVRPEDLVVK